MWCANDKNHFDTNTEGQISPNMPVGKILINLIKNNELNNVIDIGTWNGLGSTRCFLLALQENSTTNFISLETNKEKNLIAKENLAELLGKNKNANLVWGSILKKEEVVNVGEIFPEFLKNTEYQRWHSLDLINIDNSPYIFDMIPIDFVLFDGGEFTTHFEFQKIFPLCKKFIALNDVNVDKCKNIRQFLLNHHDWTELEYINERNGFSLFVNINCNYEPKKFNGVQYRLADNWYSHVNIDEFFNKPINYLEIGAFYGANLLSVAKSYGLHSNSKLYCIDPWQDYDDYPEYKTCQSTIYNSFMYNIEQSGLKEKIIINRGLSNNELPKLDDDFFDIIYIDGNHEPEYVLEDAVLSFRKLKKGGIMIFDDYGWGGPELTKKGIDGFLNGYHKKITYLGIKNTQVFIKKTVV